jgi:hypothetical protein
VNTVVENTDSKAEETPVADSRNEGLRAYRSNFLSDRYSLGGERIQW